MVVQGYKGARKANVHIRQGEGEQRKYGRLSVGLADCLMRGVRVMNDEDG